jgi:hypothetical protein
LQGVEPNWLMHSVSSELQRGQAMGRFSRDIGRAEEAASTGGTMP